ncbi:hypothetical protein MKW92_038771, partial [Papaver armeniacum]
SGSTRRLIFRHAQFLTLPIFALSASTIRFYCTGWIPILFNSSICRVNVSRWFRNLLQASGRTDYPKLLKMKTIG